MDEALRGYKFVCIRQTNSELKRELCRLRGGHLAGMTVDDLSARARIKRARHSMYIRARISQHAFQSTHIGARISEHACRSAHKSTAG